MCDPMCSDYRIVVLELKVRIAGGKDEYGRMANFLQKRCQLTPYERFVVALSAEKTAAYGFSKTGAQAKEFPRGRVFDLLSATVELKCAALLSMQLERVGISAVVLNIHEAGVQVVSRDSNSETQIRVEARWLRQALSENCVVAVPGSFATNADGSIVSLGPDGADFSAVALAQSLDADRWEIIRKSPASLICDPRATNPKAKHSNSGPKVNSLALQNATAARIPLLVRDMH